MPKPIKLKRPVSLKPDLRRIQAIESSESMLHCCGLLHAAGYNLAGISSLQAIAPEPEALESRGYDLGAGLAEVGRAYFRGIGDFSQRSTRDLLEAAISSVGLVSGVGESINTAFLEAYQATTHALEGIVLETELRNYQINERYRLENLTKLQDLPRGGQCQDVSAMMEAPETFRGIRKALVGRFDEQDLADFPWLLPEVAKLIGIAARNFYTAQAWKPLLANDDLADGTAFFAASRGNDADQVLDEANLAATVASMHVQRQNGEFTGHRATYLVVAEALRHAARKLVRQIDLADDEDLIVRSDPRIDAGMTDPVTGEDIPGNPTRWFVFASVPAVELSLLDPTPQISTWKLKEGQFGLGWGLNWSIGSVGIDPRAAFRRQAPA